MMFATVNEPLCPHLAEEIIYLKPNRYQLDKHAAVLIDPQAYKVVAPKRSQGSSLFKRTILSLKDLGF